MPKKSVPGSARLHKNVTNVNCRLRKNVTKAGSRLRSVTRKRNQGRFPVKHAYVNSPKRCVTDWFHGYARNRVTGYADPCF